MVFQLTYLFQYPQPCRILIPGRHTKRTRGNKTSNAKHPLEMQQVWSSVITSAPIFETHRTQVEFVSKNYKFGSDKIRFSDMFRIFDYFTDHRLYTLGSNINLFESDRIFKNF